jgi:hypothetical protein
MMGDLILYLLFAGLGYLIGYNRRPREVDAAEEDLPNEVKKLQEQLKVMHNLKQSLLDDVKFWREKAKDDTNNTNT